MNSGATSGEASVFLGGDRLEADPLSDSPVLFPETLFAALVVSGPFATCSNSGVTLVSGVTLAGEAKLSGRTGGGVEGGSNCGRFTAESAGDC